MTKPITELLQDIKHRWIRVFIVALLTSAIIVSIAMDIAAFSPWSSVLLAVVRVLLIAGIVGIIATDTTRGLHHSKSALYVTAISAGAWLTTLVDTFRHPPETLFAYSSGGDNVFSLEFAPITFVSAIILLYIISGSIAYSIGRKRGDIRGTQKQKIFK